jgi:hypothetical protein
VNVAAQESDPASYLNRLRFLLKTRQSQPALRHGAFEFMETGSAAPSATAVLAFRRFGHRLSVNGNRSVLCVFNLSDVAQQVTLADAGPYDDLLHPDSSPGYGRELKLAPHAVHWLVAQAAS